MNKNQLRSEQTRKLLTEKIFDVVRSGKIDDFTIRGLCSELGFSPRTFYLYFESKEHAINECYSFEEDRLVKHVAEINATEKDPGKRLSNIFSIGFRLSIEDYNSLKTIHICMIKVHSDYIRSEKTAYFKMVHQALLDCEAAGYRFTTDTKSLTWELIDFYRGIVYNYVLTDQGFDLQEVGAKRMLRYFDSFLEK